ncbi:Ku protein [Branchiibius sp. NY16-3462-2]|uniref:non-homologous end joining protein Ku n=1 Tax=Branchiibius sp. NY16-3462-2 TaxID=1807500 RepID=UPI000795913A|nr:Ku protein [Branchiibius sp. NY16-3462-2]KYH46255.1 Ku protein [Branchiibius sp. NY16-3462-2]
MRAIWKGAVSFGLVNVPVRLYSATENHDVQFRQVHREDGGRIRYRRVCAIDGEEVSYNDIAKGYETEDGQMVVLTDDDLANLPISTSREIAVDKFVPASEIDPLYLDKSYYLEPDASAVKPYALLRDALLQTDRVALVTITIRTRMTIAVLRVRDEVIALQTMLWPDEVRTPEFGVLDDADLSVKPAETAMAQMLVESLAGDYEPDEYTDDYEEAIHQIVEAKLAGGEVTAAAEPQDEGGQVVDLLAALQQSVDRAKAARGEKPTPAKKAPAKKAPAKKAPAKKTAAKKAPAKKKSA